MAFVSLTAIRPRKFRVIDQIRTAQLSRDGMRLYLNDVKNELNKGYQTVPESESYTRTFNLYSGWVTKVNHDGSEGTLTNIEPYAVYVVGPKGGGRGVGERQSQLQRRRGWESITDVAKRTKKDYVRIMNRAYGPGAGSVTGKI